MQSLSSTTLPKGIPKEMRQEARSDRRVNDGNAVSQGGADRDAGADDDVLDADRTDCLYVADAWYCGACIRLRRNLARTRQPPHLALPPERPRGDTMMGAGGWDFTATHLDPLTQPLPIAAPPTWVGREDRVRWCRENLTPGEQALIVKLSYDVDKVTRDKCDAVIAKEKKTCQ